MGAISKKKIMKEHLFDSSLEDEPQVGTLIRQNLPRTNTGWDRDTVARFFRCYCLASVDREPNTYFEDLVDNF